MENKAMVTFDTAKNAILSSGYQRNGFTYAEIPIDMLNLHPTYQRLRNMTQSSDLVQHWDDRLCDDILVSDRDGKLSVIDGQARCLAAKLMGRATVGCKVVTGLTLEQEARIFSVQTNCVKRLDSADAFKAEIVAKDKTALGVKDVCDRLKIKIGLGSDMKLKAIKTVKSIYERDGYERLYYVLDTLVEAGWREIQGGLSANYIKSIARVYNVVNEEDLSGARKAIVSVLKNKTPHMLIGYATLAHPGASQNDAVTRVLLSAVTRAIGARVD